jgi:hypothetical protein
MATLDPDTQALYVRALLAIARADREIDAAEGNRLDEVVKKRFPEISVGELMFEPTLRTDELSRKLATPSPEIAKMFVEDALGIMAAQNGLSSAEESALLRFATLFGMADHEVRAAIGGASKR